MSGAARQKLREPGLWVVKIGSALLTDNGRNLNQDAIDRWCGQIAVLRDGGSRVILVSSGAVAEGCRRLGLASRPESVHELQAAAAAGQMGLVEAYERALSRSGLGTAMVLLTHDDFANRGRYLNARTTLTTLLDFGVVPVINENDSVATEEIKLGDNDMLSAMVASALGADVLVLLTDQDGLLERDPRVDPDAELVRNASADDPRLDGYARGGGVLGRGGMVTKVAAARLAARSGTHTVIANGTLDGVLLALSDGEEIGTVLAADVEPLASRKRWIAGQLIARGEIALDAGAVEAVRNRGVSVLAVGAVRATGEFRRGDMVRVTDAAGTEVAKGLVNYSGDEIRLLLGAGSDEIEARLGYVDEPELIHRDNLAVL